MNMKYKLYLSVGLLFSTLPTTTISANVMSAEYDKANIEKHYNNTIHSIFECFFNEQDKTIFSKFIGNIIEVLQLKRNIIQTELQKQYDEIIALLHKHKDNNDFKTWAKILIAPELKAILPDQTQKYIDSIPNFKKIKTLINKLNIKS